MNRVVLVLLAALFATAPLSLAHARAKAPMKESGQEPGPAMTAQQALDRAEQLLDAGGDASEISAKLHRSRGLTKDEKARLDLIDARCSLLVGQYASSLKVFGSLHKTTPDDARITEWYARALDGSGKGDTALPLLKELADKDSIKDGDSYWTLAQIERTKGQDKLALEHAKAALTHPIVLQSDELDKEIHKFISELSATKK